MQFENTSYSSKRSKKPPITKNQKHKMTDIKSPTSARPTPRNDLHWYTAKGELAHQILGKTTNKLRPTTIKDAREHGYLPSVTSILKVLHKEALVNWMIEQACLAILTAPRKEGEGDDAFVHRVLVVEEQQHEERNKAADKGKEIHAAIEDYFAGNPVPADLRPYIDPVAEHLETMGMIVTTEKVVVGDGYAGRSDLIIENETEYLVIDAKSTERLPDPKKGAYLEHRLQLAGYAKPLQDLLNANLPPGQKHKPVRTANVYIHRSEPGKFVFVPHDNWQETYEKGFLPLVAYWQWQNNYFPRKQAIAIDLAAPVPDKTVVTEVTQPAQPAVGGGMPKGRRVVVTQATATLPPGPR